MRLLLDTHVLLWRLADDPKLPESVQSVIDDAGNEVYVSAASAWEIAIKRRLGKLEAPADIRGAFRDAGLEPLPITMAHAEQAGSLPLHHSDPFDRMLVAQALSEGLTLVTRNSRMASYGIAILPA